MFCIFRLRFPKGDFDKNRQGKSAREGVFSCFWFSFLCKISQIAGFSFVSGEIS